MPAINSLDAYETKVGDCLQMNDINGMGDSIGKIRVNIEQVKSDIEAERKNEKGLDQYALVIDGEPIVYNKTSEILANLEILIEDLKYEEWQIYEEGMAHRTKELEKLYELVEDEIKIQEAVKKPTPQWQPGPEYYAMYPEAAKIQQEKYDNYIIQQAAYREADKKLNGSIGRLGLYDKQTQITNQQAQNSSSYDGGYTGE